MNPTTARILRVAFYAYVAVTFLHIAYVVHHEPFAFDAWNVAIDTHAKPGSIGRFFEFWHQQYTSSNPRLGQPLAYLAYKFVGFAEIGTPLVFFAIVIAGFVLGTRRWPSRNNNRDLATLAIAIGFLWFAAPNLPAYMFCRAYATNYLWAIAIQLWFLVPLRLHGGAAINVSIPKLVGYGVLGVAAGMCNEHTGPTLLLFTVGYAVWSWRKHHTISALLASGILGAIVGYAIIFFAPGQSQRYEGLAEHYSVTQQILVRGLSGNVDIFISFLESAAALLVVVIGVIVIGILTEARSPEVLEETRAHQHRALKFVGLSLLAGATITITVFASPKLGARFFLHPMALLFASTIGVIATHLHRPRSFAPFVILAVIASSYAMARTIPLYTRLSRDSDRRLAELAATPTGGVYTAQAWDQIPESWWALGDDVRDQKKQEMVAHYFGLDRVLFRGGELLKPLGISDVKLTMHYDLDKQICLDEIDALDIKPYISRDVPGIHHAFLDAIAEIQRVSGARVQHVDLLVTFLGSQPPMPRKQVFVGRWRDGVLEGYTAGIRRSGRSRARQLVLSPELKKSDFEMYVIAVGDTPRTLGVSTSREPLTYEPWRSGQYWITACKPDYCFVVFTISHVV